MKRMMKNSQTDYSTNRLLVDDFIKKLIKNGLNPKCHPYMENYDMKISLQPILDMDDKLHYMMKHFGRDNAKMMSCFAFFSTRQQYINHVVLDNVNELKNRNIISTIAPYIIHNHVMDKTTSTRKNNHDDTYREIEKSNYTLYLAHDPCLPSKYGYEPLFTKIKSRVVMFYYRYYNMEVVKQNGKTIKFYNQSFIDWMEFNGLEDLYAFLEKIGETKPVSPRPQLLDLLDNPKPFIGRKT